jgi:hypothetical protein
MSVPLKYPNATFAMLNERTKLIEIIDCVTGEVVAQQATAQDLLTAKSDKLVPIQTEDGTLIYLEKGLSLENLNLQTRKNYMFDEVMAQIICQKLASGMTMTKLYKEPGIPPAAVIRKWRKDYPEFEKALRIAVNDRGDYYHDKVIDTAHAMTDENVGVAKEQIKAYQWGAQVGNPDQYGTKTKISGDANAPLTFMIDTGIRRPGDPGYNEDATEKLKKDQARDVTPLPEGPPGMAAPANTLQNDTDDPGDTDS